MNAASYALAVMIGVLLPLQVLLNAALGKQTGGPLFASMCSFFVGSAVLTGFWLAARPSLDVSTLGRVPWWAWTGGMIGALYVAAATLLIPRTGAAALMCLVVLGQLVGALLVDHFGILNTRQPIDALRLVGVVLVAGGALLVVKPWQ